MIYNQFDCYASLCTSIMKIYGEFLDMREQAYQMYKHGRREPNHETTIKIADYFDVSLDYLLGSDSYWKSADKK